MLGLWVHRASVGTTREVLAAETSCFVLTVELNEVGFKFVRKCINAVETKGKEPMVASECRLGAGCPCSTQLGIWVQAPADGAFGQVVANPALVVLRNFYRGRLPNCWQQYSGAEIAECLFW